MKDLYFYYIYVHIYGHVKSDSEFYNNSNICQILLSTFESFLTDYFFRKNGFPVLEFNK